jgi:hypothetical protein
MKDKEQETSEGLNQIFEIINAKVLIPKTKKNPLKKNRPRQWFLRIP